jgi:twitching motility protein PilT
MDLDTMNKLLTLGVQQGASDIHFRPGDPPTYRVNGVLRALKADKLLATHTRQVAWNLIQDPSQKDRLDTLQEMDCSYTVPGVCRFRVNLYRQRGSLSAVLRIIPAVIPTLEMLRLPPVLKKIAHEERGLILVTGATGSGKTSTLAALIDEINNTENLHILTIEDPIEFLHKNNRASISQREIGTDTHDYANALRAALRQDPDVIFVGEMRDTETIDIAIKAAETGHLVLSTVHTTDASKTVNRLISVFPAEEQMIVRMRLADTIRANISQRLLPTIDGKGRCAAVEVMVGTKTVQEYIRDPVRSNNLKDVIEKGRDQYGMQSFDQHLTQLYKAGIVSLEVAKATASNPADFERALNFE